MRYTGSKCKRCRAVNSSICGSIKCALTRKPNPPGQHGAARKKRSEYATQLLEKQKIRWSYDLSERQFFNTFEKATKSKDVTGTVLLQLLETRLDNVVSRSGMVTTLSQARQLISHGHFLLNGKKVSTASIRLYPGDKITVKEKSKPKVKLLQIREGAVLCDWLNYDKEGLSIEVLRVPERDQLDQTFREQLVIEYYSRR
jgi:small subunit ribosomal protein S4